MGVKDLLLIHVMKSTVVAIILCAFAFRAPAAEMVLAENGQSAYQIVLADNASPSTRHGAEELQMFLEQITGVKLPVVSDEQPQRPKEIILGDNAHFRKLGVAIDFDALGQEGYVIRTVGEHLVIAGGQLRGNMYGVYGFLEDHLGCRWFAPAVSRIPKIARLAVGPIDDRQVPALEYREPFLFECFDGDWCARNRMNSSHGALDEKHGGKVTFADGFFAHTFERLVPPEKYFDEHPEYFALVRGERQREQNGIAAQLCCTNPEVVRICTEQICEAMKAQPGATVFSVSPNDSYEPTPENERFEPGWCECEKCQALAWREDSQIAPVLQLVNQVAEAVEKDFPDTLVETLAYRWTRRPPKHMRPRPNVVIRLCTIECCFSHPLAKCDSGPSRAFRADLEAWANVAPRLWLWDYGTDFAHYLLPYPNQRARSSNIRFFVASNVKGVFVQDCGDSPDSELCALGGYITAKCLWNPHYDANRAMSEFLEGYYGKAADPIRAYIDLLHDYVDYENIHVIGLDVGPESPHLTDELLTKANTLWRQAENCVAGKPETLQRVQRSRMSVDYAILERARLQSREQLPANARFMRLATTRFKPFFAVLEGSGASLAEASPLDKEAYRRDLAKDLGIQL